MLQIKYSHLIAVSYLIIGHDLVFLFCFDIDALCRTHPASSQRKKQGWIVRMVCIFMAN